MSADADAEAPKASSQPSPTFFLNLAVSDTSASGKFYAAVGFTPLPTWSDEKTKAFLLPRPNEAVCLMIHHGTQRFKEFIRPGTQVADPRKTAQAMFSITADDRAGVDAWLEKAVAAGGSLDPYVMDGYGESCGMYSRAFEDVDGHVWEVLTMLGGASGCAGSGGEKKEKE